MALLTANNDSKFFSLSSLPQCFSGRVTAATLAGCSEIAIFHPFDTAAKRLMSHHGSIRGSTTSETMHQLHNVIFRGKVSDGLLANFLSLYPGALYAVIYKVFQRAYKFAGQPYVREFLYPYHRRLTSSSGKGNTRKSSTMVEGVAGCIIGIGEVLLLPLDRLKVLSQTNPKVLQDGLFPALRREGIRGMYAGATVTAARNAPGSFFLFGGTGFAKRYIFNVQDYNTTTFYQNMVASAFGACVSITASNPMDVVKTRVQRVEAALHINARTVAIEMFRKEGFSSFFKGLTPKIVATAPKLIFAYTLTEYFLTILKVPKKQKNITNNN